MDGDYLYNKVLTLVDYCGDVRGGRTQYSITYSPNNIRRLYLCPDGAIVRYHINAKTGLERSVSFPPNKFEETQMSDKYKPMLNTLSADRVCASIEEIVICTSGKSGLSLDSRELDFQGLIKSYKNVSSDIKTTISNRYKRLVAFIVFDGTMNEFLARTKDFNSSTNLLVDSEWVRQSCKIEGFQYKDWFKRWGTSGQFYALDRDGSPLNKHFKGIVEKIEKARETENFDRVKKEQVATQLNEFDKKFEQSLQLIRGYTRLRILESKSGLGVFTDDTSLPKEMYLTLIKHDGLRTDLPNLVKVVDKDGGSNKKAIESNIDACKEFNMTFYTYLIEYMLKTLVSMRVSTPVSLCLFLEKFDRAIRIPPDLEPLNQSLPYQFEGARWVDSLANMFTVYSFLILGSNEMCEKARWLECIKG